MKLNYPIVTSSIFALLISWSVVYAHNNVAVIPLAGETVEVGIHLDRTQIVGGSGTDLENGNALTTAVAFVNGQSATSSDPWLIRLEPGTYDIGNGEIELNDFISLQGAGMRLSKIVSSTTSEVLRPGSDAQISELWIESTRASSTDVDCMELEGVDNVVVRNFRATNAGALSDGIHIKNTNNALLTGLDIVARDFGIFISGGLNNGIIIRDSHITSTGDEAFNAGNSGDDSVIENSIITALGAGKSALNSFGGSSVIRHSTLISTTGGTINNSQATTMIEIYNSFVDVADSFATRFTGGTAVCSGIATPSGFSSTTCQ